MESYVNHDVLELRANISIPERLLLGYDVDHYVQVYKSSSTFCVILFICKRWIG